MRKVLSTAVMVLAILSFGFFLVAIGSFLARIQPASPKVAEPSVLFLRLDGVIIQSRRFIENLVKYGKEENIKGVLIQINSPGGVVGPSQEIYTEIKRIRDTLKKPVVVSCAALAASGAYYAAVAADKIVTNPGTLMGSIGVIMEFANLEKLFTWAKIDRYALKTGPFKDSGSPYRPMREDERRFFQALLDQVWVQFKGAVKAGRNLSAEVVEQYSDGRIFTGETAVELGFADQLGALNDAVKLVGEMSGLGDDPELYEPPRHYDSPFEMVFADSSEDEAEGSMLDRLLARAIGGSAPDQRLLGKPLYLMPGALGR